MTREIKFRGKRKDNGEWANGYYTIDSNDRHVIWSKNENWEVPPESVGQYTGLKDKNGKEIYEGDILQSKRVSGVAQIYYSEFHLAFRYGFFPFSYPPAKPMLKDLFLGGYLYKLGTKAHEIIGNIYENPELLK